MSHKDETDFEMNQELNSLAQALRESRPKPEPEFTESLDQAVADHFPSGWTDEAALGNKGEGGIGKFTERLRRRMGGRRKVLLPAMAGFAGLLLVATVVVGAVESGRFGGGSDKAANEIALGGASAKQLRPGVRLGPETFDAGESRNPYGPSSSAGAAGPVFQQNSKQRETETRLREALREFGQASSADSAVIPLSKDSPDVGFTRMQGQRDVAKEAEITLGTDPSGVQDVANEIVSVTDDHNGIIMNSNVTDGEAGRAGATFNLLIPSGQLESAVADLSGIADLRSRSQELTDITAPTNRAEDQIADSKAKIKSLLGELEVTYDETERENLERRIRWERYDKRAAETRLNRLERRADYTPVGVRIETGDSVSDDGSGSWGISDAVDDAGKMLGVAAGVTLIALAVAIPIGIVVLIALAINRAWVRRARRKVLADD